MGEKGIVTGIEQANVLAVAISITGFYFHFLAGSRLRSEPRRKIETKRRCEVVCEKKWRIYASPGIERGGEVGRRIPGICRRPGGTFR